jgi:hypothetical protein
MCLNGFVSRWGSGLTKPRFKRGFAFLGFANASSGRLGSPNRGIKIFERGTQNEEAVSSNRPFNKEFAT